MLIFAMTLFYVLTMNWSFLLLFLFTFSTDILCSRQTVWQEQPVSAQQYRCRFPLLTFEPCQEVHALRPDQPISFENNIQNDFLFSVLWVCLHFTLAYTLRKKMSFLDFKQKIATIVGKMRHYFQNSLHLSWQDVN